jgi:hypothetical protein
MALLFAHVVYLTVLMNMGHWWNDYWQGKTEVQ